jgi:hypothetical protein
MSQQASDLPRSVQMIGRYRSLIGFVTLLGALAGIVFAALNPPTSTRQTLVVFTAPTCPAAGAICGGPMFSPGYIQARLLKEFPSGVQVKPVAGDVLSISVTAGTPAQAEAIAQAAAHSYIAEAGSLSYLGEQASVQILQSATSATGTPPLKQMAGDALLGAVLGALLGIIAALAASQTIIDPPTVAQGLAADAEVWGAGQQTGYSPTGLTLLQMGREYAMRTAAPDSPIDG